MRGGRGIGSGKGTTSGRGVQDVVAKSLGSANPHKDIKDCINGLKSQNSPKILSAIRGKKISEIILKREAK